ncbi:MAG: GreA/GreB family elongation factor [Mariprofundaceae bacterium]|nr:GreA/GreB family elongation factor [Mariprofundaceae bacterium]
MKNTDKAAILALIIQQLETDINISAQAVKMARDTATHKDCLGSSKYETMGLEASYLAQGQGTRLLELERSLAYFKQVKLQESTSITLETYIILNDEDDKQTCLWMAGDAGGLKVPYQQQIITVITPKSPLGKAIMGKNIGDDFSLKIMAHEKSFEVLSLI